MPEGFQETTNSTITQHPETIATTLHLHKGLETRFRTNTCVAGAHYIIKGGAPITLVRVANEYCKATVSLNET